MLIVGLIAALLSVPLYATRTHARRAPLSTADRLRVALLALFVAVALPVCLAGGLAVMLFHGAELLRYVAGGLVLVLAAMAWRISQLSMPAQRAVGGPSC